MTLGKPTCADVVAALERKYPAPKYATIVEFERVDLLVVGTWASTKWVRIGFEVKVSRTDWLRELRKDGKAAQAMSWLDEWWVAALVEITARGVKVVVKASPLRPPPKRETTSWEKVGDYWTIPDSEWAERMRFAMLARRYDYRDADASYLEAERGDGADVPLDLAAAATGRITGAQRAHARLPTQAHRERAQDAAAGRGNPAHEGAARAGRPRPARPRFPWVAVLAVLVTGTMAP